MSLLRHAIRSQSNSLPLIIPRAYIHYLPILPPCSSLLTFRPPSRPYSSSYSHPHPNPSPNPSPEPEPASIPLTQRLKALSKKYGWWAVGVYTAISLVDFSIAFLGVSYFGAERVQMYEKKVMDWVKRTSGWGTVEDAVGTENAVEGSKEVGKVVPTKGNGIWTVAVVVRFFSLFSFL